MIAACSGIDVRVDMIVLRRIRPLFRMVLTLRNERCIHAPVLALLDRAVGILLHIAFAKSLAALVGALDRIGWFRVHCIVLTERRATLRRPSRSLVCAAELAVLVRMRSRVHKFIVRAFSATRRREVLAFHAR